MLSPFSPPGAAPPTHDSKTWYSACWVECGRPRRRAVSRATSHTPVSVRRPHSCASRESAKACALAATSGAIPRVSSGTNVAAMSSGSARFERATARLRAMSSPNAAADSWATATQPTCMSRAGVERVTDVVVAQVGAPGQRGSDQARAHRRARRQPETQVGDHRETAEEVRQSEALRHASTVGARITTAVDLALISTCAPAPAR